MLPRRLVHMSAPHSSLEIEIVFDVDADTPLPALASLPGVAAVSVPEARALDAVYLDTPRLELAARRSALRRRTGGHDAGWHLKVTEREGRREHGWPLDEGSGEPALVRVPAEVVEGVAALAGLDGSPSFEPIARVRNDREAYALTDAEGALIAEFTDDRVQALDLRRGAETSWREWEFELGPAGPASAAEREALFDAVRAAVAAVGGRAPSSGSKLQRALGG